MNENDWCGLVALICAIAAATQSLLASAQVHATLALAAATAASRWIGPQEPNGGNSIETFWGNEVTS